MTFRCASVPKWLAGLLLLSVRAPAATMASCNADFTACNIPENVLLQLPFPFPANAGDVVLTDPNSTSVSDVFRIFNNIVATGRGTGLGDLAFLYSSDDTSLPPPSTYSANAVFITEDPSGYTHYLGNGTDYFLGVPEPQTLGLFAFAACLLIVAGRCKARFQGGL